MTNHMHIKIIVIKLIPSPKIPINTSYDIYT